MEVWKDIPNYEGHYQVSSLVNVKSLKFSKERILKPSTNMGYLQVIFCKDTVTKAILVHQLVSMAFLGHKPNGHKIVVNHKNFIKTDNRVENLEIVTQRENSNLKHFKFTSKYVGVSWCKTNNKWKAYIKVNKRLKYLGSFDCELEASKAYQNELKKITKL